jgi:two-component system NarL family sensor kinase
MQDKLSEVTLILIGSTVIILMLTGLIVISLFIDQKRKYRYRQEKQDMKNIFNQELLRAHLEIQSQAFETISRELHDNVGTLISIAMVHIRSMNGFSMESEAQKAKEADNLLNEAMDTLRDISRSINPENINRLGWKKSFIAELERIRKTNLFSIHLSEEGNPFNIELRKQVILFRILQETLNNIVKHSSGNRIDVRIIFSDPELHIILKDNGKGMDHDIAGLNPSGSGISNMTARAAMLPATFDFRSEPGNGTVTTLVYKEMNHHAQPDDQNGYR